jgi:hypothetical protein
VIANAVRRLLSVHGARPGLLTRDVLAKGMTFYLGARMSAAASPGTE